MTTKTATVDEEPMPEEEPKRTPRRRRVNVLGARDPRIEEYLNEKGVAWEFIENVSPGSFDLQKSMKNQARLTHLVPSQVETYIDAMKRGDVFPPLIAHRNEETGKLITIDGNHRLETCRQLERPMNVYVVSADPKIVTLLTFEANTKHGVPTNQQERVTHALWLIDTGASQRDAAAAVGAPLKLVQKDWQRRQAGRRADEVGIIRTHWEALHQSIRTRLLNLTTDEVFKAASELAYKANLSVQEVFDLVAQLNESRSVTRQLALLELLQGNEYADRISGGEALFGAKQGRSKTTPKTRASQALGHVLHLPDDIAGLASQFSPQERESAAARAREAEKKLGEFAEALEAANSA
jgi:hypothetical protein